MDHLFCGRGASSSLLPRPNRSAIARIIGQSQHDVTTEVDSVVDVIMVDTSVDKHLIGELIRTMPIWLRRSGCRRGRRNGGTVAVRCCLGGARKHSRPEAAFRQHVSADVIIRRAPIKCF